MDLEIRPEEGNRAAPPAEEREEARLAVAAQAQESRAHRQQQTLDLAVADLRWLGLEPRWPAADTSQCPSASSPCPRRSAGGHNRLYQIGVTGEGLEGRGIIGA